MQWRLQGNGWLQAQLGALLVVAWLASAHGAAAGSRQLQQSDAISNSDGCITNGLIPKCEPGACATRNVQGTARWVCLRCLANYLPVVDASGQDNIIQCGERGPGRVALAARGIVAALPDRQQPQQLHAMPLMPFLALAVACWQPARRAWGARGAHERVSLTRRHCCCCRCRCHSVPAWVLRERHGHALHALPRRQLLPRRRPGRQPGQPRRQRRVRAQPGHARHGLALGSRLRGAGGLRHDQHLGGHALRQLQLRAGLQPPRALHALPERAGGGPGAQPAGRQSRHQEGRLQ
jgi:hypothetical protein